MPPRKILITYITAAAVRDARNNLYGIIKREQHLGKNARFIGVKLFINGRAYFGEGTD